MSSTIRRPELPDTHSITISKWSGEHKWSNSTKMARFENEDLNKISKRYDPEDLVWMCQQPIPKRRHCLYSWRTELDRPGNPHRFCRARGLLWLCDRHHCLALPLAASERKSHSSLYGAELRGPIIFRRRGVQECSLMAKHQGPAPQLFGTTSTLAWYACSEQWLARATYAQSHCAN